MRTKSNDAWVKNNEPRSARPRVIAAAAGLRQHNNVASVRTRPRDCGVPHLPP
jgi:hypothetical protein